VILDDTGPIVAAALTRDTHHRACVVLFTAAHRAGDPLAVPSPAASRRGCATRAERYEVCAPGPVGL
jgi:hypothetical protein